MIQLKRFNYFVAATVQGACDEFRKQHLTSVVLLNDKLCLANLENIPTLFNTQVKQQTAGPLLLLKPE